MRLPLLAVAVLCIFAGCHAGRLTDCGPFGCYKEQKPASRGLYEFVSWLDQSISDMMTSDDDEDETETQLRSNITFNLFFTKNNPSLKEVAMIDDKKLFNSYDAKKPTKIIIHGWQNNRDSPVSKNIKNAYMSKYDVNVIVVDWSHAAFRVYHRSKLATVKVAAIVAEFIDRLFREHGLDVTKNLHVIGHSLGAHISGIAARTSRSGTVARVTGLDPAAPLFDFKKTVERLSQESAAFVEVIHTCGKRLGMREQLGHVDVYPNSGDAVQIGCANDYLGMCSHSRAHEIYVEALQDPKAFMAIKCANWETFRTGICNSNEKYNIGENVNTKARGTFFLKTNTVPPLGMGQREPRFTLEEIEEDKSWQEWASKLYDWVM